MDTPQTSGPASHDATIGCKFCAGPSLRRSRFRTNDISHLLLLQWPVRCLTCSKRQYASLPTARQAISSRAPHAPELLAKDSWQNFTATPSSHDEVER